MFCCQFLFRAVLLLFRKPLLFQAHTNLERPQKGCDIHFSPDFDRGFLLRNKHICTIGESLTLSIYHQSLHYFKSALVNHPLYVSKAHLL